MEHKSFEFVENNVNDQKVKNKTDTFLIVKLCAKTFYTFAIIALQFKKLSITNTGFTHFVIK